MELQISMNDKCKKILGNGDLRSPRNEKCPLPRGVREELPRIMLFSKKSLSSDVIMIF